MRVRGVRFSSDVLVKKSPNDRRSYRYLQLHNGLSALLVHDPDIYAEHDEQEEDGEDEEEDEDEDEDDDEDGDDDEDDEEEDDEEDEDAADAAPSPQTKKAAAALCVGMGSFSDPYEAQGLAHFLEHMLFMGSAAFPDENEYDSYLSKHGGSSNAYTETEHTCYHFDVKPDFLKGALQRFSQFFISPLVKGEAMDREVLAVDSEFNQVLQSDSCRLQQLQCHTSISDHPFNRFFWGNKKSLMKAMEKGVDLRAKILKMFEDNYCGGVMKLVVIGGESLDILESWVLELFTNVKKGPHTKLEIVDEGPIWNDGKLYRLEAVKDVHILEISWKLPCLHKEYLKKSEDYLAHLIGHEGRGSLHFFLKSKGWITSISAGVGDEGLHRSSLAYIFCISIRLTDSGLEKIYEIIGFIYQYLKLLRDGPLQKWIFKELQEIGNMEFRFIEEQPQDDYAVELAENLLLYSPEHVIYGGYTYEDWDAQRIESLLSLFTPKNMRIDILSKSFTESRDVLCEPWFGARYTEEDIILSMMDLWRDPPEIEGSLHLPIKNEFIPVNFSVHKGTMSTDLACGLYPRCILDEPLMRFWYKLDNTFKLPRANTYFRINLNGAYESVRSCLLTELFVLLLKDELNETIYQASIAKLDTSISVSGDRLELKVYGFSEKLPLLLSKILSVAKCFLPEDDRFKVIKEDVERTLRNANMKPLNHASYLRLQVLCKSFWDVDDKIHCLADLSVAELQAFIPKLLSQLYIEALCHGNLLEEEALSISNIFRQYFSVSHIPVETRHGENILCLSSGANVVRDVCAKNKLETNSVVELYYQIEQESVENSVKLKGYSDLFDEIVQEPLFNQLRTKEQLGYVVQCGPRITYRVFGFCFCVQSSKYDPAYLLDRIDNFVDGLKDLLEALDDGSFESFKSGLIARLLEKDPSLTYETDRHWNQVVDKRYTMFDLAAKEAEVLVNIKKSDLIEWYSLYFGKASPKCRRLAIRVWGCNTDFKGAEAQETSMQKISDPTAFKSSSDFYPSLC
ncbi:hypothetical protein RND81_05G274200 [Saponaria officinalis]|uniref:Nardilysin-like n=1 Tax=Saponaria officinalis TaxID=3572 RepID=A0AAW1L4B3_SAPOF